MQTNVWNLHSSKQRLEIMERTQAQKKHLINILRARSKVDHQNPLRPRHSSSPARGPQSKLILKDNQSMVKRLVNISKLHHHARTAALPSSQLSRNLKTYSSATRTLRIRQIEQENSKMFSRLITTSPTIQRKQWIKREIQTCKYKENLHRSKYMRPDYSVQACKIITRQPKFRNLNFSNISERSAIKRLQAAK